MELNQYLDSVDINKVTMEDIKSNALKIINDIELVNYFMKVRFGDDFIISDNDKLFYEGIKNDTTTILQKTLNHLNAIDKLFSNKKEDKKEDKKEKVSKKQYFKDYYQKNKDRQNELQRIRRQKKKLQKLNNDLN